MEIIKKIIVVSSLIFVLVKCDSNRRQLQLGNKRIYGGFNLTIERVPFFVQIIRYTLQKCAGSIISHRVVLTAAHCTVKNGVIQDHQNVQVLVGSDERDKGGKLYGVEKLLYHPQHAVNFILSHDVGLLFLKEALVYSTVALAVFLPNSSTPMVKVNYPLLVMGVGNGPLGLQGVLLPVVESSVCDKFVDRENSKHDPSQFCLGNMSIEGQDSCQGDSGGPVIDPDTLIQYGVISWGYGCGQLGYPGMYSNIVYLHKWIRDAVKNYYDNFTIPN